jgi:hypothetical protein
VQWARFDGLPCGRAWRRRGGRLGELAEVQV